MKKTLLIALFLFFYRTTLFALPISDNEAKSIAFNFFGKLSNRSINQDDLLKMNSTFYDGERTYFTFIFKTSGFVMVSADDAIPPILGYSVDEIFDENNVPLSAQYYFNDFSREISSIQKAKTSNKETRKEWDEILAGANQKSILAVSPLCATTWNQTNGYNNLCPSGTPTGCVATAMAQVMKKWNYPAVGDSSHSYTHATYGVLSADFGATTYNWASMSNTSGGAAVSTLMYHCGVSVNMDYAPAGSGAYTFSVPPAFKTYFRYHPSVEAKNKSNFATEALWAAMVKEELDEGRPLMLAGSNNGTGGHEWVCDGYQTNGTYYHMNWGWGGSSNGYFRLYLLNPAGGNYSDDRQAVIRICPLSNKPIAAFSASTTYPAVNAPVDFIDESLQNPTSWLWTFDGGTPATSTDQNPTGITFATNGYHCVSLKVTNADGTDIKTRERYVKVGGSPTVWTKQNVGFSVASRAVDQVNIVDANTVWVKAYDATNPTGYIRDFSKTTDGGANWVAGQISYTNSTNFGIANIYALNAQTAYACMFPTTGNGGNIVKTIDGGATWTIQTSADFTTSWPDFVHFFDANNGVCMGDPTATTGTDFWVYTTNDGGNTWTHVPNSNLPNCLTNEAGVVNHYSAVDNTIWFTTNKGRIYKSVDKGLNWTVNNIGITSLFKTEFMDANVGIAILDTIPYTIKKTNNGGSTWTTLAPTGFMVSAPTISFIPGTNNSWINVASYPGSGSSISFDGGVSFNNIDTGSVQFTSVAFWDDVTGWAGSINASSTDGGIYKWNPSIVTGQAKGLTQGTEIRIFPNPSNGVITIGLGKTDNETLKIDVYNAIGELVLSEKQRAISNDFIQIDLSGFSRGMYVVKVDNGERSKSQKIQLVK